MLNSSWLYVLCFGQASLRTSATSVCRSSVAFPVPLEASYFSTISCCKDFVVPVLREPSRFFCWLTRSESLVHVCFIGPLSPLAFNSDFGPTGQIVRVRKAINGWGGLTH